MFNKLKSRKFWAAIVGTALVSIGSEIGLPPESVQWAATIITGYIVGQGIADAGAGKSQTSE